jgi:hypothetical protein
MLGKPQVNRLPMGKAETADEYPQRYELAE